MRGRDEKKEENCLFLGKSPQNCTFSPCFVLIDSHHVNSKSYVWLNVCRFKSFAYRNTHRYCFSHIMQRIYPHTHVAVHTWLYPCCEIFVHIYVSFPCAHSRTMYNNNRNRKQVLLYQQASRQASKWQYMSVTFTRGWLTTTSCWSIFFHHHQCLLYPRSKLIYFRE